MAKTIQNSTKPKINQGRYALIAVLLGLLAMLLPASVDGSVAMVPAVATHFSSGIELVQLSLSALVLGIAFGQLVYGPLSDCFGRKPIILVGITCYSVAAASCTQVPNIEYLIILRFLQGFFACSGIIVARALIRDLFNREAGARLFALMMGIHGIMPAVAPGISGWMTDVFGWQSVFWAMSGFGVFVGTAVMFGLAETNTQKDKGALRIGRMAMNYRTIIRNRAFCSYAICACFIYGALMAYFAGTPVALIQYLGLTPQKVGIVMAVPIIFYIMAQLGVARIAYVVGIERLIGVGAYLAAAASSTMLFCMMIGIVDLYTLMGPVIAILVSVAFIIPSTTAGALAPFANLAGAASSLLGFIQFLAASLGMVLIAIFNDGTPLPMAFVIFGCAVGTLLSYLVLVKMPLKPTARLKNLPNEEL
ncbi:MAG: multidrug effflux MFS transporter [Pseudomonadota bacterium]|nr:multidrug effflux MFS transporter [Pseudomonadota bacterium]